MVGKTEQVAIRLEPETIAALDALGALMSKQMAGAELPRSTVIRTALARGIEVMQAEIDPKKVKRRK